MQLGQTLQPIDTNQIPASLNPPGALQVTVTKGRTAPAASRLPLALIALGVFTWFVLRRPK